MPERLEKLRTMVEQLEAELHQLDSADDAARQILEGAVTEIQQVLSQGGQDQSAGGSLTQNLQSSVQQFEASHPTLAGLLNRIVDVLGQLGI